MNGENNMKEYKTTDAHFCSNIAKKRLEFDIAYCDATYDSIEGRDRCYMEAKEDRIKNGNASKHS